MLKNEVVKEVMEVLHSDCDDPAEELIRMGKTLIKIGTALKPLNERDARHVMMAVQHLV